MSPSPQEMLLEGQKNQAPWRRGIRDNNGVLKSPFSPRTQGLSFLEESILASDKEKLIGALFC